MLPRCLCLLLAFVSAAPSALAVDKDDTGPFRHLKYRLMGPSAGGRVSRTVGVTGDPTTYYAATASGGIWKSVDGGFTWKSIFDEQPTSSMGSIAVAPSDPNVIYVGSGEANIRGNVQTGDGIFKSTNGGKTWHHVWKQRGQIGQIIVHPHNPDVCFAAVLGSPFGPNLERGIYRTTDGGKVWKQVLKKDADTGAIDVCFDLNNPRILFAALWQVRRTPWHLTSGGPGSGIYRTEDGGETWTQLMPGEDSGLPDKPWGRVGIAVAPSDSQRIYALIEAEKGGLYSSEDGGEKWELVNSDRYLRQRPWYFSTITVDPINPEIVWCPTVRLLKSIDGGKSFKQVRGVHHVDHHSIWIDRKNPRRIVDSNDAGPEVSTNAGHTWHAPGLPIAQFYHISADTSVPYRVMGTMQDLGTASGPSNSLSSAGITLGDWYTVGGGETGFAVADPSDPNIVYAGEYGGYISRYNHRTRQAENVSVYPVNPSGKGAEELRYRFQWVAPILVSPHNSRVIYHAANVLFRTEDGGKSWQAISPDLTRDDKAKQKWSGGPITGDNTGVEYYCTIFAVAESPRKAGVIWTGSDDGLVHVTIDAGKNWVDVTPNIPDLPKWSTITCIEASPHDAGTAYVVADAHRLDDDRPYLWKTTDYGKNWVSLAHGLPKNDFLRVVREDPRAHNLLYLGTEHVVRYSPDGGDTWQALKLNMPTAAVSDLIVKDNDLVVGTSGRSIWILDDLTPVRQWSKKLEGSPHLFAVQPAIRWRYRGDNWTEDRAPGDNPLQGAIINYYLPTKPKDELKLEIFDEAGKFVCKFSSKKEEPEIEETDPDAPTNVFKPTVLPTETGINRIDWDLTSAGPKLIPGAKNDYSLPYEGPLVVPGSYTMKLRVDGKVLVSTVEVKMDPRVQSTPDEIRDRHKFAMQIYAEIGRLADTVLELRSVRDQIKERADAVKKIPRTETWVKEAKGLLTRLDTLEEKLHNPRAAVTYDILAQQGGAKLYSQLVPLYNAVTESDGPVTQGMRDVFADHVKELRGLERNWQDMLQGEVARLNERARALDVPTIVSPRRNDAPVARPAK